MSDLSTVRGPRSSAGRLPGAGTVAGLVTGMVLVALPFYVDGFWLQAGLFAMTAVIGAIGLNLLTGAAGQLSMGHAFFLAVGAYTYVFCSAEPERTAAGALAGLGLPTWAAALIAVAAAGVAGGLFSPIAGRLSGPALGIATLALVFLGQHVLLNSGSVTGGVNGRAVPPFEIPGLIRFADGPEQTFVLGVPFGGTERLWYLGLLLCLAAGLFARGVLRGRPGRALNTIRDHEIAAGAMGVPVARYRAAVFVLSSMYAGLAGVLAALVFQQAVPEYFGLALSLDYLAMIVIGGLGTVAGAAVGAVFVSMLPLLLTRYSDAMPLVARPGEEGISPAEAARMLYGVAFVAVLLFLPGGVLGLAARIRRPARPGPTGGPVPSRPAKHPANEPEEQRA